MNSKGRRFFLYLMIAAMIVTQVAFTKTEKSNTADELAAGNIAGSTVSMTSVDDNNIEETTNNSAQDKQNNDNNTDDNVNDELSNGNNTNDDAQNELNNDDVTEENIDIASLPTTTAIVNNFDELEIEEVYLSDYEAQEESSYENMIVSLAEPYLSVRSGPSKDNKLVGKMYPGSYANVIERGDTWTKVKSGNVTGYIQNQYVCFDKEAELLANQIQGTLSTGVTIVEEQKKIAEEAAKKALEKSKANQAAGSTKSYVTASEAYLLAAIIDWEANSEIYVGKLAVGYAVNNRIARGYGSSVESVLLARGQFGGVADGNGNFTAKFQERINKYLSGTNNDCLKAAYEVLAGSSNPLLDNYINFNTRPGSATYQQIGNHYFWN